MISLENEKILVTGAAGFIGAHLIRELMKNYKSISITGIDNMNDYYDINLKKTRLSFFENEPNFTFYQSDISNMEELKEIFLKEKPTIVVNLAAQAGVRYSITNPEAYLKSNMIGFFNILECCRYSYRTSAAVKHLVYASSSSVYGLNKKIPYSTEDKVDAPVSFYAATKKSNELMAHSYSKLYGIAATALRFFTVYGPMGRPDMAYFSFTDKLIKGEPIQIYNHGEMYRDFTYIDDIVNGVVKILPRPPKQNEDGIQYKVYNIGNNKPESLMYFVNTLEQLLLEVKLISRPAVKELLPMQPGDVYQTYADIDDLIKDVQFKPKTSLFEGLKHFVEWYKEYYKNNGS